LIVGGTAALAVRFFRFFLYHQCRCKSEIIDDRRTAETAQAKAGTDLFDLQCGRGVLLALR